MARNYNVAIININYHCIGNRPHLGSSFYLDDIDKIILDTSLKTINLNHINVFDINSYENLNNAFIRIDQEIQKLVGEKLINPVVAARINRKGIVDFYQTEVGQKILKHPADYHREVPFSMIMNGHELFKGVNVSDDERILIHGIIDGYLKNDEGIVLVDYKTDHLNKDYRDFDLARIKDRYRGQLELYKEALNLMEGIPVVQMGLYLLELGEFVLFTKEGD